MLGLFVEQTQPLVVLEPEHWILDMPFPECTVVANVIAGCKSDVVGSNKCVNKSTSSEDIQQ